MATEYNPPPVPKRQPTSLEVLEKADKKAKKVQKDASKAAIKRRVKQLEKKRDAILAAKAEVEAEKRQLVKTGAKVLDNKPLIVTPHTLAGVPPTIQTAIKERPVAFKPNPGPQTEFLAAAEREVLYGGAAGGGKSIALIIDPLRYCDNVNFRAIIFRRTNDQLREIIQETKKYYPQLYPKAKWSEQKSVWTFPSGATIWLTYLDRDDDVYRYHGQAYTYIGFDELTNWPTPYPWDYMRSRLRTTDPTLPLYMRATTNPGGPGSWWVKEIFIDPAPPGTAFAARQLESGTVLTWPANHPDHGKPLFYRRFIPARLTDNPYLMRDGNYEANLLSLPDVQRKQLLEGDWDVVQDCAFPDFNRSIHVIEPFTLSPSYPRFRAADYGYSSPACCLWMAVGREGEIYVYQELYAKGLDAKDFADRVLIMEQDGARVKYGVLDSSCWDKRGVMGPTLYETMRNQGCLWKPADKSPNSRFAGKNEIHKRLKLDPITGKPNIYIFKSCKNLIRTLPALPIDKNDHEDIDTDAEDHAYDALRYGLMSRPYSRRQLNHYQIAQANEVYVPFDKTFGY